jgi:hypothetical protein
MERQNLIRIVFWAVLGVLAAVLLLSLVSGGSDDNSSSSSESTTTAELVSVDELQQKAAEQEEPIYWAGEQAGTEIEFSQPEPGRTYVRYLTEGAPAGDPSPNFLTIGSYQFENASEALRKQSKEPNGVLASAPGGGVVYFNTTHPQSVYLAYPDEEVQIEVYDPNPRRALGLVSSGLIVPVG